MPHFNPDPVSKPSPHKQEWNARRIEVLTDVVTEHLLPTLRAELRTRLLAESREAVLRDVGDRLWEHAVQAPVKVRRSPAWLLPMGKTPVLCCAARGICT